MEAIIRQAILSFVATVNEDGTPSLSPKASLTMRDGTLYFADIASPRTIRNLRRDPAVEINVIDIFQRRGYRFTGRGVISPHGSDQFSMIADWVLAINGPENPSTMSSGSTPRRFRHCFSPRTSSLFRPGARKK